MFATDVSLYLAGEYAHVLPDSRLIESEYVRYAPHKMRLIHPALYSCDVRQHRVTYAKRELALILIGCLVVPR